MSAERLASATTLRTASSTQARERLDERSTQGSSGPSAGGDMARPYRPAPAERAEGLSACTESPSMRMAPPAGGCAASGQSSEPPDMAACIRR
ncbi:hypothetical protein GCM10023224_25630 [Streptomonospora halophila]|uniref:Uncharacterized protein n=1 Tax=Streptomonospora halophila TaxID=427369 RepID=A0ABP9GK19_9ACTN